MMYRRNAAQTPRPTSLPGMLGGMNVFRQIAVGVEALWNAAWRENRRHDRLVKRYQRHTSYRVANVSGGGKRERERRIRQIIAGSLRADNGVVFA